MFRLVIPFVFLAACGQTADVARGAVQDVTWVLTELDGNPFTARAVLRFATNGLLSGQAPCNGFTARVSPPRPLFRIFDRTATELSCADLAEEARFFSVLDEVTLAERLTDRLVLTSPDGRSMVFVPAGALPNGAIGAPVTTPGPFSAPTPTVNTSARSDW